MERLLMNVAVKLEIFEGPLDLLLHLIRKNEVDIYDIPVALITRQYLDYLDMMREMNISLAGEFLVMASTLTHIKSRMLLPTEQASQDEEESEDPRVDLIAQLKEHMRIKAAAGELDKRPRLGRDVFDRLDQAKEVDQAVAQTSGEIIIKAGLFDLIEAFRRLMQRRGEDVALRLPPSGVSLEDRMSQLLDLLRKSPSLAFEECFPGSMSRQDLVITFLAVLELTRMGFLKIYQQRLQDSQEGLAKWGSLRIQYQPPREEDDGGEN